MGGLGIVGDKGTYLKIGYLFLSFPLGIFYFVFLVVGFSVGFGLAIIVIGIPIFIGVLLLSRFFVELERQLARGLLGLEIPPIPVDTQPLDTHWDRLRGLFLQPSLWRGIIYLVIKFPLGIISFVIAVTSLALSFALITAPWSYFYGVTNLGAVVIHSLPEAMVANAFGLVLAFFSLIVLVAVADAHGKLAKVLLSEA